MSARKLQLALALPAQRDLRNLLTYTERQWGKEQRRVYRRRFTDAFAELMRFPDLGVARPELGEEIRTHRVGQHVVIYRPADNQVLIVRILHARRDLAAEFERP